MKQGKALKHNVGIAKWYYDELDEMTEEMTSETKKQIEPLYKRYMLGEAGIFAILLTALTSLQDKFYFSFKDKAAKLVKKFIEKQLKYARFSVSNALKPIATETTIARLMKKPASLAGFTKCRSYFPPSFLFQAKDFPSFLFLF